jgi:hypothetical protein
MIKLILSQIFFAIIVLILTPSILIRERLFSQNNPDPQQTESFISSKNYNLNLFPPKNCQLSSISFRFKNPLIANQSRIVVDISSRGQIIQSTPFSGANVGDPSWINLKFIPKTESSSFSINLHTQNQDHASLYLYTNNVGLPVYQAWCRLNPFASLNHVVNRRLSQLKQVNHLYLSVYLGLIIGLNYALFPFKK